MELIQILNISEEVFRSFISYSMNKNLYFNSLKSRPSNVELNLYLTPDTNHFKSCF